MKMFLKEWVTGAKVIFFLTILFLLSSAGGGVLAIMAYSIFVSLPAEILFHYRHVEDYNKSVFILGGIIGGVHMIGQSKHRIIEMLEDC